MFLIGTYRTYQAFAYFFNLEATSSGLGRARLGALATGAIITSVDAFLIGLVLLIFAYGVYTLFIRKIELEETVVFHWLEISSITSLKTLLAELIIIILFVKFLNVVIISIDKLTWEILILPASILLLALSLKFFEQRH
jgi:uncharacterized membrane protein YqhA